MSDARQGRRALFGLLFLLSGAAGLVYEQIWIRELQHFFGSTIHSITTVVAAYMGGLGLGAWVTGRRADRRDNPAMLYGMLEIAIGVFGLLSPLVFAGVGAAYLGVARVIAPGLWLATAIKFVFSFVVMLVPTFLMGGTLPVLTRAFAGKETVHLRRELALFYGLNTVGGVLGCALGGYYLIEYVGLMPSLIGTGVLNLALGFSAIAAVRRSAAGDMAPATEPESVAGEASEDVRRFATWLIGLTAFASLLYEIAWTRVLVLVVGSSTYAFTTILVCFLLGIGIGSLFAIGKGRGVQERLFLAALIQGAIAVLASLLFPFFRALPIYIVATMQIPFLTPTELTALHSVALAVVIIPPAIGMGLAFPVLAELAARRGGTSGTETGRAYFANTLGSIAGAVITGFLFIHLIGSEHTLAVGVAINAAAALAISWRLSRERGAGFKLAQGERAPALLGLLALIVALLTPGWSSRLLDRGPAIYGRDTNSREDLDHFLRGFGSEQLSFDEGWNATVSVWRNGGTTWLKTNGKADASSIADMNTQVMVGMLAPLASPHPRRVFVIGFGSGASAHNATLVQGVEHVDIVEIERAVIRAAPLFNIINGDVLHDPKVRLIEDDARSALQLAKQPYDVIVSEPSNPWIAGVSALYTRDYFEIVKKHLAADGVFGQWVQTYRVPVEVVAVVVANMRAVFPHVEMWYANTSDLILLASNQPIRWDRARVAAHLVPGTPIAASLRDWLEIDRPSGLLGRFLLGDKGTDALAKTATFTHTDDQPTLEFVAARGLLATGLPAVFDSMVALRRSVGDSLPLLQGWTLAKGELAWSLSRALQPDGSFAQVFAEQAVAAAPHDPERQGELGRILWSKDSYRAALPHLEEAVRGRPTDPRFLLYAGLTRLAVGDVPGGRALLTRARNAGGDSAWATAALAELAVRDGDWPLVATEAMRSLKGLRPTIATPFPGSLQNAIRDLALNAPPPVAAPVMEEAMHSRPSWDLAFHGGALTNVRWGGEHCPRAAQLASEMNRFGWTDDEVLALLRPCAARPR
jgi:predicted membrane-bound spermidine synthase